ncbi:MAG: hypothetical protein BGO43_00800 [Gammaproteobacteria bacterium 39-13]|nr:GNAT family N-acetyltransferase [Gammaproteobacteria bacterium]OJV96794.1 MAG: hypothetical protein BGO43_00800 [Gammaproteobacteria bacterium 39-13]
MPSLEIIIRKSSLIDLHDIAKIHLACWKENYKELIEQNFLDSLKLENLLKKRKKIIQKDPNIQLVAVHDNKVIGFCDAGPFYSRQNQHMSREKKAKFVETGELYAIYVCPRYQNQGAGRALFFQAKIELIQRNLLPFIVWTLNDNYISRRFYESLGGILIEKMYGEWGGQKYLLVAYRFEK